jgi:hypothetical protein
VSIDHALSPAGNLLLLGENLASESNMSWHEPQPKIYNRLSRFASSRARRAAGSSVDHREDYSMDEYREFVERIADGGWPSETILNRSSDHAAVILENLFRKAVDSVEILTSELKTDVYGIPGVIVPRSAFCSETTTHASTSSRNRPLTARSIHSFKQSMTQVSAIEFLYDS